MDRAEWHRVVVFQKAAENCSQYLTKGSLVFVEGSLQTRKWQDQQGQDRYTTEISAPEVGEDALHPQVVQREYPLHLLRLLRQKAEAAKAGIHRQMHPRIHVQRVDGLCLSQTLHRQNDPPL